MRFSGRNGESLYPDYFYITLELFEFPVSRKQLTLIHLCQGSGEAIGVGDFMFDFKSAGFFGQRLVNIDDLDGKRLDSPSDLFRLFWSMSSQDDIITLAEIDGSHKKIRIPLQSVDQSRFDFFVTGLFPQKSQESLGIPNSRHLFLPLFF